MKIKVFYATILKICRIFVPDTTIERVAFSQNYSGFSMQRLKLAAEGGKCLK
jgi:hypothetical protein